MPHISGICVPVSVTALGSVNSKKKVLSSGQHLVIRNFLQLSIIVAVRVCGHWICWHVFEGWRFTERACCDISNGNPN